MLGIIAYHTRWILKRGDRNGRLSCFVRPNPKIIFARMLNFDGSLRIRRKNGCSIVERPYHIAFKPCSPITRRASGWRRPCGLGPRAGGAVYRRPQAWGLRGNPLRKVLTALNRPLRGEPAGGATLFPGTRAGIKTWRGEITATRGLNIPRTIRRRLSRGAGGKGCVRASATGRSVGSQRAAPPTLSGRTTYHGLRAPNPA